jgi:hypothetical protein
MEGLYKMGLKSVGCEGWSEFMWLRTGTAGGLLWAREWTFMLHTRWGICQINDCKLLKEHCTSSTKGLKSVCEYVRKWQDREDFCFICWHLSRYRSHLSKFTYFLKKEKWKGTREKKGIRVRRVRVWQLSVWGQSTLDVRHDDLLLLVKWAQLTQADGASSNAAQMSLVSSPPPPSYCHAGQQRRACNLAPRSSSMKRWSTTNDVVRMQ